MATSDISVESDDLERDETLSFQVSLEQEGMRLDAFLVQVLPQFSRTHLKSCIQQGLVTCQQQIKTKSAIRVHLTDAITIRLLPTPQSQAFSPEPMELPIVFEDEHILVINKPVGLVVHPGSGNWSGTLLNGLLAHHLEARNLPRAGIVHRLDKNTSGLMVVAKTPVAVSDLIEQIAAREVSRQYFALAHGIWRASSGYTIDAPIGRDRQNPVRMGVIQHSVSSSKPAQTTVELIAQGDAHCALLCRLHTGRTHQIRVHLAHIKHPLVGDTLYGGKVCDGWVHQALHAWHLSFVHPVSGEKLSFDIDLPARLMALCRKLIPQMALDKKEA